MTLQSDEAAFSLDEAGMRSRVKSLAGADGDDADRNRIASSIHAPRRPSFSFSLRAIIAMARPS